MFLLFEDEWGTINLIVPREVYERHRALARAEPLLLAHGRLERTAGERLGEERIAPIVNVLVRELLALEQFVASVPGEEVAAQAQVHRLHPERDERVARATEEEVEEGAALGASLRAVVPAVQSFGVGRRR
jgi:error-prone DNA polymerase